MSSTAVMYSGMHVSCVSVWSGHNITSVTFKQLSECCLESSCSIVETFSFLYNKKMPTKTGQYLAKITVYI